MTNMIWVFFILTKLLLVLTTCQRTLATEDLYFTDNIERDCPKYEDILPNGMCHKYLKTNRIAQTVETMHRKNKDLFGFYEIGFKFIKLWFTGGTPKMSLIKQWLGDCLHNPDIEKLVEELPIPSLEEMENCLNSTREIVCYVYHPPCLHKPADNGYKYIPRGICRESCDSFYGGCQKTLQFLSDANKVNIQCKRFPVSVDLGKFPECQDFISKDTQKIEKCLLLEKSDSIVGSKSSFSQHRSSNCFLGKGKRYRGKMNITKSGKKCVNWNKIPYLNNISFPSLEKNFCRNPEGYGLKPWCYVNTKNRTWEYCEIKACEDFPKTVKDSRSDKYPVWIICALVVSALVLLVAITATWSYCSRNKNQDTKDLVQPYEDVSLKDSDDVVKQIQEFDSSDL